MATVLTDLSDDILVGIFCLLSAGDVNSCAQTCRRLNSIAKNELLWSSQCHARFGDRLGNLKSWPKLSSSRTLFAFLTKFAALEGHWAGHVYPRGQLLTVRAEMGALVGRRVAVIYRGNDDEIALSQRGNITANEVFRVVPREAADGKMGDGVVVWSSRPHAGVDETSLDQEIPPRLREETCLMPSSPAEHALAWGRDFADFQLIRPLDADVGDDLSKTTEHVQLRYRLYITNCLLPVEKVQKRTWYRRLQLKADAGLWAGGLGNVATSPTSVMGQLPNRGSEGHAAHGDNSNDGYDLTGLWWGPFGPHGPEILQVTAEDGHFVGRKVTGDPNVPCGQISIRVSAAAEQSISGTLEVLQEHVSTEVVCLHRGAVRVAEVGFTQPEWTPGLMLR